jgi:type II secretion system protein N
MRAERGYDLINLLHLARQIIRISDFEFRNSIYLSRAVQKLLKGFLFVAGVLVAVAAVGVLAINLYVQSAGTQKRIENALSSGLKAPVLLTSTIVTPWSGLKASGITVAQTPPMTGNFLEAASFTAHFDWLGLLRHRLDARKVSLDEPRVEWFQTPGGRWDLPRAEAPAPPTKPAGTPAAAPGGSPAMVAKASPGASARPAVSAGTASAQASAPAMPAQASVPAPHAWQITVHKLMVDGASFDFWDYKGNRVSQFSGVQFECLDPKAAGTGGAASCKNVSLHDRLFFDDMQTNWSYGKGALKFTSFKTELGGGEIRGDAQVYPQARRSPFNVDVNFDGVNVDRLVSEAGGPAGEVTGMLKGWLDLNGSSGRANTLNGIGHLELTGGRMQNIEILQMLGRGLQIPDLVELNLKAADVDARVANGVVNVDKLLLQSQNLQVTGTGTMEIGKRLALKARLTINGTISERMPSFILANFKPGDAADSRYIDFDVYNTLGHPKTDLLENILGHRVQNEMSDLINSIFGKKQKKLEPEGTPP